MVLEKIKSMDISENDKRALEEIFLSEINHGNNPKNKEHKITNFREIIVKRQPQ